MQLLYLLTQKIPEMCAARIKRMIISRISTCAQKSSRCNQSEGVSVTKLTFLTRDTVIQKANAQTRDANERELNLQTNALPSNATIHERVNFMFRIDLKTMGLLPKQPKGYKRA